MGQAGIFAPVMLKKWFTQLAIPEKGVVIIALLLIAMGIVESVGYTTHYGGNDLRTRVVGARVLQTGESPYFYKWHPGDDERLADPSSRIYAIPANALTVAPGLLYFQSLFTWMPYPAIRIVWNVFQYLLCMSMLCFFLFRKDSTPLNKVYIMVVGGIFFLSSDIWFFNIEAGQIYILFPFFMCLLYYLLTVRAHRSLLLAGILVAMVAYGRPNFILMAVPMLIVFEKRFVSALLVTGILLLVHAYFHMALWKDYFSSISFHTGTSTAAVNFSNEAVEYPTFIEGVKDVSKYIVPDVNGIPSLRWLFIKYQLHSRYIYAIFYVIIASGLLLFLRKKLFTKEPVLMALTGFLLYIISEYFIPTGIRGGYNLVQWIFPVALLLSHRNITKVQVMLMITGLCLVVGFPLSVRFSYAAGELLLVCCVIDFIRRSPKPSEKIRLHTA